MNNIMTGTAETEIKLVKGMDLTGYVARTSASIGMHDKLKIKCIMFYDGSVKYAFVECDLLGLSGSFSGETAELVEKSTAIPANHVVIACTHTHSGPASIFLQNCGEVSSEWLENLKKRIVKCVNEAHGKLKPSLFSYKTCMCDIGVNRTVNEMEGAGKRRDEQVGVLTVRNTGNGEIDTIIVNYACHPVVLDSANLLYSGDYPYYVEEAFKKGSNRNSNVIFAQGCCGDIDAVERGGFEIAKKLGYRLYGSIIASNTNSLAESDFKSATITVRTFSVNIPLDHHLDEIHLLNLKTDYHNCLDNAEKSRDLFGIMSNKACIKWVDKMLSELKSGTLPGFIKVEVKVVKIGKLVMVMLPFEVFHEVGLKIKKHFGYENTMVVCYANGNFGYLPSVNLYYKSQYEVKWAYKYYGYPGPVCADAENIILNQLFL